MKIAMFTNTFTPHVGGVAHSVSGLADELRKLDHQVLVVAPKFPGVPDDEQHVNRIPALQKITGNDYSLPIPASRSLARYLGDFEPDLVHSHHPFLLGGTALRISATRDVPVIYTHHTHYEQHCRSFAIYSQIVKRFALNLTLGYCDLCDAVIAPSESTAAFLAGHNITAPIVVIPTGADTARFKGVGGVRLRRKLGIPECAFVIGHVGRLAPEKNLGYLAQAFVRFLDDNSRAHVIFAGRGKLAEQLRAAFATAGLLNRAHFTGVVIGEQLAEVYAAMNVFAFSSLTETQGLVLSEAMCAGTPVVALDAPGASDVVDDGQNGFLLPRDASTARFAEILGRLARLGSGEMRALQHSALQTAKLYSRKGTVQKTLHLYGSLLGKKPVGSAVKAGKLRVFQRGLVKEWKILGHVARAVEGAILHPDRI